MIIMYDTQIPLKNTESDFDEILSDGLAAASLLIVNQSGTVVQPLEPIKPVPVKAGVILGAVLTSVGGIIWLFSCFMIVKYSPEKKSLFWKAKECIILALGISNFRIELGFF